MKQFTTVLCFAILCLHVQAQYVERQKVESGVAYRLAQYRRDVLSQIKYQLHFSIPEKKTDSIPAKETLTFNYRKTDETPLQIDFKEASGSVKAIKVNSQMIRPVILNEHIVIEGKFLKPGSNKIEFVFTAGNTALNRREGYLYTLFVPDRARTMFPCFDQPDLKARFLLSLTLPRKWNAIANGKLKDSVVQQNTKTFHFSISDLLPTYLFSFAAGEFKNYYSRNTQLLYRETDTTKIQNSLDSILTIYWNSIRYYEQWTGIPYPFQKHGMIAVPDFQFGGMEHPGAILFQNSSLFLDKNATQNQLNARSGLIAHETAHQWFGDMVTMNWFTDVWMKEVFANFMADKSTGAAANKEVYDLKFLTSHFPAAYSVDRTPGANPIRQSLDNLQNAGMLYGPIIYDKAPIMMRQLEHLMGEENFRIGVDEYLKKYAYGNASWPDLIALLGKHTTEDLESWNRVWVNETGRPIINYEVEYNNNKIDKFVVSQHPEYEADNKIWAQTFQISLYYPDTSIDVNINFSKSRQEITELKGRPRPSLLLMNSSGIGYGVFRMDSAINTRFSLIKNPVGRASAYISLYENMLNNTAISPDALLHFFAAQLRKETTELNLRLVVNYITSIYWEYLSPNKRSAASVKLEQLVWDALQKEGTQNNHKILLECYENIFLSQQAYNNLYQIWQQQTPPQGIVLNEEDYTSLALALALRNNHNDTLLQAQLSRIRNPDRITRFKTIMQAVSSDPEVRKNFFYSLSKKENRTNESAIGAAISYLHHPLRQETAISFLPTALELLQEIQRTGDIFFPDNWLRATFYNYEDPKALDAVHTFLSEHPDYNPVLKNKILQATDNLRRAQVLARE